LNKVILANYSFCHIDKIEFYEDDEELYDIDVEEDHSFLLDGGFVVHNSAGGSAKQGRNNKFQAILPLRGKVINAEKASVSKTMENKEIRSLISALNVTPTDNGNVPDADDLRFHNIILLADGDVDGAHINCLMMSFFYNYMRTLIERGHVKIAQPPLYRVKRKNEYTYLKNDEELDEYRRKYKGEKLEINRFKGLGEMNPDQLAETVLNPETRSLITISLEDAEQAAQVVNDLMGKDSEPRKKFVFKDLDLKAKN